MTAGLTFELTWTPKCLIVWGGLRLGGIVTVHLPATTEYSEAKNGTLGAKMLCMPGAGFGLVWSWEFGYEGWSGAIVCRRCFSSSPVAPKAKHKPKEGWLAYTRRPTEERIFKDKYPDEALRREAVVRRILAVSFEEFGHDDSDDSSPSRIIEV